VAREEMSKEASHLLEYSRDTLQQVPGLFAQHVRNEHKSSETRINADGLVPIRSYFPYEMIERHQLEPGE
jgi:hypothetical protein